MTSPLQICLLGLGEVGQILATDLDAASGAISAWDPLFTDRHGPVWQAAVAVRKGMNGQDAVRNSDLVISAVTAAQTRVCAEDVAPALKRGAYYVDLNSASPGGKQAAARAIDAAGGRYVEAAVMASFPPTRLKTPMLLGGPHAESFAPLAAELGFSRAQVFAAELGKASAAKMCRSVLIKGLEALLTESLLAARRYEVDGAVLASLSSLLPAADWPELARYMISRSLRHGRRRAEEMREVATTVREAGLSPAMSTACATRQELASAFAETTQGEPLDALLDTLLAQARPERPL